MLRSRHYMALVAVAAFSFLGTAHSAIVTNGLQLHLDANSPGGNSATTWEAQVGGDATLAADRAGITMIEQFPSPFLKPTSA